MITKPGQYQMSLEEYLADPCPEPSLNASLADLLLDCPMKARLAHPRLNPTLTRTYSDAFDFGTAVHRLTLEGDDSFCVIAAKDWKTKAAREAREVARVAGQLPLLEHQMLMVLVMADAIQRQVELFPDPRPFREGKPEQVLIWQEGPVWCRARLDWLHDDHRTIDDLKTTGESANPAAWTRRLFERGHDLQVAFHTRGVKQVLGQLPEFRFFVAETEPPHPVSLIGLDPEGLAFAYDRMFAAITRWGQCLQTGTWPGYPPRPVYTEVPPYVRTRWQERGYFAEALHDAR